MTWRIDVFHHLGESAGVLSSLENLKGLLMSTQAEHAAALEAVSQQVAKIGGETRTLLQKVIELTDALAAAGGTTPEVDAALAALQAQVLVVDELVVDA